MRISSQIRKPFLIYDFEFLNFLIFEDNLIPFLSVQIFQIMKSFCQWNRTALFNQNKKLAKVFKVLELVNASLTSYVVDWSGLPHVDIVVQ
jgi:hypothetical protein